MRAHFRVAWALGRYNQGGGNAFSWGEMAKAARTAGQDKARGPRSSALRRVGERNGVLCFVCLCACVGVGEYSCMCTTYVSLCLRDGQRPRSDAIRFVLDVVSVCVCAHVHMCVCECTCVCMCVCYMSTVPSDTREYFSPWSWSYRHFPMWTMGTELWSSGRAVSALKQWALSPTSTLVLKTDFSLVLSSSTRLN